MKRIVTLLACAVVIGLSFSLRAEVVRTVHIESTPGGARVYLLRANQQILIGTTPLDYRAEFHSEQSVLRLVMKYPGYEPNRLEISATKRRVVANLARRSLVLDPDAQTDPMLRKLQREINPELTQALTSALALQGGWSADPSGRARVQRLGARALLVIPLTVTPPERSVDAVSAPAAAARHIWTRVVAPIAGPMLRAMRRWRAVGGVVVDARFNLLRHEFHVEQHVQTHVEMRCVERAELKMVWGELMRITDPCASMKPVTVYETKIDPSGSSTRSDVRAVYLVPAGAGDKIEFSRVAVLLSDHQTRLWQQGSMPPEAVRQER